MVHECQACGDACNCLDDDGPRGCTHGCPENEAREQAAMAEDEYDDYGDEIDGPEFLEDDFDCGYVPHVGICTKAGSEECDWDCPYREEFEKEE